MTSEYKKPLPNLDDPAYAPFWAAAKRHELAMPRCTSCGHVRWPMNPACTECLAPEFEWATLSGRGELFSWTNFYQQYHPEWGKEAPYNVSMVKLPEGPVMLTNVTGVDDADLRLGMPLEVWFDDVTPDVSIPKFRPAER
jgi:uncharacterized OB-fold protein